MVQLKYFGDSRDYFKYDLITSIFEAGLLERYVFVPMLTRHRNDKEGRSVPKYNGDKSLRLHRFIRTCPDKNLGHWKTWLTPCAVSYQTVEPVNETYFEDWSRVKYWSRFESFIGVGKTLVFVDPDIGLETGSQSYRRKMGPEKYILNNEVHLLFDWLEPASILMIYQHLPRDRYRHISSTQKKLLQARAICENSFVCAYSEGDLAFVFLVKSEKIYKQLQHFLKIYFEKSMQPRKAIVRLHGEAFLVLASEFATRNSNIKETKEIKMSAKSIRDDIITNAEDLTVRDIVSKRVLCPGCHKKVFEKWPLGWDAHAAFKCTGVKGKNGEERKEYFKQKFNHLFQKM